MGAAIVGQVKLWKGDRRAIVQGVAHTALKPFWDKVQRELDVAASEGYHIFCEGITADPERPDATEREKKLRHLVMVDLEDKPGKACATEMILQDNGLRYPKGATTADVNISDIVERLAATDLPEDTCPDEYRKMFKSGLDAEPIIDSIYVEYRNRAIIDIVRERAGDKNIFLLYGEAHVQGLVKHLVEDGWTSLGWRMFDFVIFM